MRYIQTYWAAGKNPLVDSYGWNSPAYHLLSWALSCMSLRAISDEVELYTDKEGYELLVERLRLPYTKAHVVYDSQLCPVEVWAYAKIKTYAMQEQPFVHVDSDLYLTRAIPEHPLIVQNKENGKIYYNGAIENTLKDKTIKLPRYVRKQFREDTLSSYCMGIFGGSDTTFIKAYCKVAARFLVDNQILSGERRYTANHFFEQVLFGSLVERDHREVYTLDVDKNGEWYTIRNSAWLKEWDSKSFHHLLGGLKREPFVERMLCQRMLLLYPTVYERIAEIFPTLKDVRREIEEYDRSIKGH